MIAGPRSHTGAAIARKAAKMKAELQEQARIEREQDKAEARRI